MDVLLGRPRQVRPDLDALFAVPAAAIGLQATLGFAPTGTGGVCFKTAEGPRAARAVSDALALLPTSAAAETEVLTDAYGYTWVVRHRADGDLSALVTDLHAVNLTLSDAGFGPDLLCTVTGLVRPEPPSRRLHLVYLFKRGTFYPFAPVGVRSRDTSLELQVRATVARELPVEPDLERWFPIWGGPV